MSGEFLKDGRGLSILVNTKEKLCKALKVSIKILNFKGSVIGSQCRSFKMGVIRLYFKESVIKQAAAFCT